MFLGASLLSGEGARRWRLAVVPGVSHSDKGVSERAIAAIAARRLRAPEARRCGTGAEKRPMFTTRPEIKGTFGVVASTHWLASAAGMGLLERGGNAFDAAAGAGFVLQVVEPHKNGPGGDMPAILWDAAREQAVVLCGQGPAPAGATIEHYCGLGLDRVPGTGQLAATVPLAFDAWMLMLRDFGTLPLADALGPALAYAENGHPVLPALCNDIRKLEHLFRTHWTTSADLWLPNGAVPEPWSMHRNSRVAATWKRLLAEAAAAGADRVAQIEAARHAWSQGFVAEAIDRWCRTEPVLDVSGRSHTGVLTGEDMARCQAHLEAPLTYDYAGVTVAKCGPWSQGPMVLQQLALLKGFDVAAMDPSGAEFVHTAVECFKLAVADRDAWYGDAAPVPVEALLSDAYNDERRRLVGRDASGDLRPGAPLGVAPRLPAHDHEPDKPDRIRTPGPAALGAVASDTCHLDVVDRWGNAVSATPSGGWMRSNPTIPALGFCLGTRLQMTWLEPGFASSLMPGRRPRTTLSPAMALRDGRCCMVFGTPGGDQQDQWQVPFLLRVLHHGMNLQEAIDAPAWHSEHLLFSFWPRHRRTGVLKLEDRFGETVVEALRGRGHRLVLGGPWSEGRLSAAARDERPDGVLLRAGANPRGMQGYAVGR